MTQTVEEIIARAIDDARDYQDYVAGREAAKSIIKALTASGFAIVPVEPTMEMALGGQKQVNIAPESASPNAFEFLSREEIGAIWTAMLQASPGYQADALKGK